MNPDFLEMLAALLAADARFLVVGAHSLAVHGVPRATGDLGIWIHRRPDDAARVWSALLAFGAPSDSLKLPPADIEAADVVIQIGLAPRRIDLLTTLTGLTFDEAWSTRTMHRVGELDVPFLGRQALIKNKRATGRHKDLADLESLGGR